MKEIKMNATYQLDIVNADDWTDAERLTFCRDRLIKMRNKRAPFDTKWNEYETQIKSESHIDNYGQLQVNIPLEKELIEIYEGRTNGKITYDIKADGQTDIEQLQPSKYALQFFLDGNGKETFWIENKKLRRNKASYGSGIFATNIRVYKDYNYKIKEDAVIEADTDYMNEKNFDKIENNTWFFHPKDIHCKDFFIDDGAYGQPEIQKADDCIYKENITASEFNIRYGNNKIFTNQELVTYRQDITPKNENDRAQEVRYITIYHYFHRITKKYLIMANENLIIYNGIYLYDDGKLPFVNIQHYTRNDRFRGEGIPERVQYLKLYKSEIMQDILAGAQMSSGVNLLVGNDDEIGQDWSVGGRQMNLWRTTGGADRVQQINTSPNLGYFTSVLQLIDQEIITVSGINPMSQVEAQAPTLGQEELLEANKAVRNSSIDENYNIGLDEALTMCLARIKQFAPSLLSKKIKDSEGAVIKVIFPKITVQGYEVKKEEGKMVFEESYGKYGYFELKPDLIQGLGVKITTQSTNSLLPTLEKQKITDYINNILSISQIAQVDQSGKMMTELIKTIKFDDLIGWINDSYGYDMNGLKAKTQKDKIKDKNLKLIEQMKNLLTTNIPTNEGEMPMQETSNGTGGVEASINGQGQEPMSSIQGM